MNTSTTGNHLINLSIFGKSSQQLERPTNNKKFSTEHLNIDAGKFTNSDGYAILQITQNKYAGNQPRDFTFRLWRGFSV